MNTVENSIFTKKSKMNKSNLLFTFLIIVFILFFLIHLNGGNFNFQLTDLLNTIFDYSPENQEHIIIKELRIPRTLTGIIAGISLSIAGLLMQTYFNNPLAGPSILGISTGSSLFVAIAIMVGGTFFSTSYGLISAAIIGAIIFSLIILIFSKIVKSPISLLIIGVMLSSFTSSFIQLIQISADPNALKTFTIWGFGSIQQVTSDQLPLLSSCFIATLLSLAMIIKPLNLLVLGEKNAQYLGIKTKQIRILIIAITAIFTGLTTSYCGPISFIGLAVPNLVKLIFKTQNHSKLIIGCALVGGSVMLICDLLIYWLEPFIIVPLNSITAIFGAPIVIWILLRKKIHA